MPFQGATYPDLSFSAPAVAAFGLYVEISDHASSCVGLTTLDYASAPPHGKNQDGFVLNAVVVSAGGEVHDFKDSEIVQFTYVSPAACRLYWNATCSSLRVG